MKLADHLSKEQKQQLRKKYKPTTKSLTNSKTKQKKQEHLSRRDWEDIMGVHRDTYERRNGAVRRK
jgi:hypothetical protein